MQSRKSKKILLYFFLLILVGSINNITLNSSIFKNIKNINVSGLNEKDNANISNDLKSLNLGGIFFINKIELENIMKSNSIIENYQVFKNYPFTLNVEIEKTNFLAKINKNENVYLVGSNGKLSNKNLSNEKIPFIFGKPKIEEFLNLKIEIDKSKFSFEKIVNFYFFHSKRWDLELENNIIIKLPKNNIQEVLDDVFQIFDDENFF